MNAPPGSSSVYLVPFREDFLLHAPLHGLSARVNGAAARTLKDRLEGGDAPVSREVQPLLAMLETTPRKAPCPSELDFDPEFLGLIPTRGCNSSCLYCDFDGSRNTSEVMALETAVQAVEWYSQVIERAGRDSLSVHFFGGEPMIAPQVVRAAVMRARLVAERLNLPLELEIATNGQYAESWVRFLGEYFTRVVLSLDGPREIQERQRPRKNGSSSFDRAERTARILSDSQAELCLRVCASSLNLDRLPEIIEWFASAFVPTRIDIEPMQPESLVEQAGIAAPDPFEFAGQFIRSRQIGREAGIEVGYSSDLARFPRWTACPVGRDAAIVSPDGSIRSCYLPSERITAAGFDFRFGDLAGSPVVDPVRLAGIRKVSSRKEGCATCFSRWSCAGGCYVGRAGRTKESEFCSQTRIITASSILERLGEFELGQVLSVDRKLQEQVARGGSDCLVELEARQ